MWFLNAVKLFFIIVIAMVVTFVRKAMGFARAVWRIGLAVVILFILVTIPLNYITRKKLEKEIQRIEALGFPTSIYDTYVDIAYDEGNAADALTAAYRLGRLSALDNLYSDHGETAKKISDWELERLTPDDISIIRKAVSDDELIYECVSKAGDYEKCWFYEYYRDDDPLRMHSDIYPPWALYDCLHYKSFIQAYDDEADSALETIKLALLLSRHMQSQDSRFVKRTQMELMGNVVGNLERAFLLSTPSVEACESFIQELKVTRERTTARDALAYELVWFMDIFEYMRTHPRTYIRFHVGGYKYRLRPYFIARWALNYEEIFLIRLVEQSVAISEENFWDVKDEYLHLSKKADDLPFYYSFSYTQQS